MVGQSVMSAIVTCLFEGSPPCSWGSLLRGGSSSLKTPIPNCSILMVVLLSGPSYSSLEGTFSFLVWLWSWTAWSFFCVNYTSRISRLVVSVIYCNPESHSLMSCAVWRICSVVGVMCHGGTCGCVLGVLNGVILELPPWWLCCAVVVIGSGLCTSHNGWS